MNAPLPPNDIVRTDRAIERLTALWALNEAGMGGLIHAIKVPFTGGVVGGIAVILISTIGFFAERKAEAILRATMVVLLIKAAVSPHTPIPAYLAVLFQGALGALLFGLLPSWPRTAAVVLGVLAFWQGAVQKLVVMTLIYGMPLWESVDALGRHLLGDAATRLSPTQWFLLIYAGYYTLVGLLTAWFAAALPDEILRAVLQHPPSAPQPVTAPPMSLPVRSKPWWRRLPVKAGLAALALSASLFFLSPAGSGVQHGLKLLIRATVAIALWMLVARPLANRALRWFQRREASRYAEDISRTMNLLPLLRTAAALSWERARHLSGLRRWKRFFIDLAASALVM
jgi:hypothetical protein